MLTNLHADEVLDADTLPRRYTAFTPCFREEAGSAGRDTRGIIDNILDGAILKAPTKTLPIFNFVVPTELPGVDPKILDPRDTYADPTEWYKKADKLANMFIDNFKKFEDNAAGKALVAAGPHPEA